MFGKCEWRNKFNNHAKKKKDNIKMIINDLKILSGNKKKNKKSPRFAFLKISTNVHLQNHTSQIKTKVLQKSQIPLTFELLYTWYEIS